MGLAISCPGGDALDERLEALIMRSLSGANVKSTPLKSVSFNGRGAEPAIMKSFGSGKWVIEGSLSYRKEDRADPFQLETKISITSPKGVKATIRTSRFSQAKEKAPESPLGCPKHNAAVKLQKVYKSFRTRRQLADCAVLVEQRWWKLLDFALLKQSSVSFFDIEEPESVVSRWTRARRRAATVGKGLSKDEKAQKLALQHWLEAIDPRHRYGHNLHFYYDCWLHCESNQPFFYWLDLGDGKEVHLDDQCPRSKLQHQCIKYLGPKEREAYEVILQDAKFMYRTNRKLIDTSEGPEDSKWIFVLSTTKTLYVGQKRKGTFQHSSFLAGGATSAAGRLVVSQGILKAVWPHSGHYRPTKQNFLEFVNFLKENNVDLTDVQLSPTEDDEEMPVLQNIPSELELTGTGISAEPEDTTSIESSNGDNITSTEFKEKTEKGSFELHEKITPKVQEERVDEAYKNTKCLKSKRAQSCNLADMRWKCVQSPMSEGHYKHNLFLEEQEEDEETPVPQEAILRRINSKKGMESYQLGKQLSFRWTTGAGPRIAWVRDYPSELQFRSLEQVHLSPRVDRAHPSPRIPSFASPRIPPCTPRIPESAFSRKVPMLQKPKMRR